MNNDHLQGEGDRFLIEEIHRGSADAFRRLVDRFSGRLKAFAARRLQGSGIDPEDAVQETFLSLLRNLDGLIHVRSLQAFLFTILRRRIADLARSRWPIAEAAPLSVTEPVAAGGRPSSYARRDEAVVARSVVLAEALELLLSRLKQERNFRDLKVLELVFNKGVNNKEAAQLAGTSEPTVSRTIKAAVEKLRLLIAKHAKADALEDLPSGDDASNLIRDIWHENLFTCLKRSTLGSYALSVLEPEWMDYVRFHIETAACEYCAAHLTDITAPDENISESTRQEIFTSSVGFLKR